MIDFSYRKFNKSNNSNQLNKFKSTHMKEFVIRGRRKSQQSSPLLLLLDLRCESDLSLQVTERDSIFI